MLRRLALPVLVALPLAAAPDAQELPRQPWFDYRFAQPMLSLGDLDGLTVDGFYSLEFPWILVARMRIVSEDVNGGDVDYTTFSAGAGYVFPIEDKLDLIASGELEYADADTSILGADDSELGIRLRGGARYQAAPEVEVFGGLSLRTALDTDFILDGGALYRLSEDLSAVGMLELGDGTTLSIGIRYDF